MNDQTIGRTELPIRRPPFQEIAERTLDGSQPEKAHRDAGPASRYGRTCSSLASF
jgi:hypothetical protein